jgi:hypothetical protein
MSSSTNAVWLAEGVECARSEVASVEQADRKMHAKTKMHERNKFIGLARMRVKPNGTGGMAGEATARAKPGQTGSNVGVEASWDLALWFGWKGH